MQENTGKAGMVFQYQVIICFGLSFTGVVVRNTPVPAAPTVEGEKSGVVMLGSPVAHLVASRPSTSPPTPTASTVSFEYHDPQREMRWKPVAMAGFDTARRPHRTVSARYDPPSQ